MYFLYAGLAMIALKLLDVSVFGELSWWWVAAPFGLALFWFEIVERRLGLDKKKAFDVMEEGKKARIERAMREARRGIRRR